MSWCGCMHFHNVNLRRLVYPFPADSPWGDEAVNNLPPRG